MANKKPLDGKVAIVTGSGRGIGRTMALALVEAGAKVMFNDMDKAPLAATVKEAKKIGGANVHGVQADVGKFAQAQKLVRETVKRFGGIDILLNSAGVGPQLGGRTVMVNPPKFYEFDPETWAFTVQCNATGPFNMARAAMPVMRRKKWGRIIGVTTSLDTMFLKGCIAYGPAKAAHEAFMSIVSQDLAGTGITANILVPGGPVNTRMVPPVGKWADRSILIQPAVMVRPLLWLCSPAADKVHGMRFRAARWKSNLPEAENAREDGAPIAWTQLGSQAIHPD
jgi:3-oxoacyl-[acyl-carrier protein] reductase